MKKSFPVPALILILATLLIAASSCGKKTEAVPDYPQLIGHWSGSTSNSTQIGFWVNNISGTLYITQYDLTVMTNGGYQRITSLNSNGIASINNRSFKIHLGTGAGGESYIDGVFNSNEMTISGSYAVYQNGNTIDIIPGTYSGAMGSK